MIKNLGLTAICQGTGLGLSLAYNIIKVHGGSITVVSNYSESGTISVNSKYGRPEWEMKVDSGDGPEEPAEQAGSVFIITLPLKTE